MTVKLFRLNTGEEIIADVFNTYADHFEVKDAVTIVYQQVSNDQMSAGFAPYMPYAKGNIELQKHAIAATAEVADKLMGEYNRIFSKIQIVPAGAI